MEHFISILLPKIIKNQTFRIYRHNGKSDLLRKLPQRLSSYRNWLPRDYRIIIILDRDSENCVDLKNRIQDMVRAAFLKNRADNSDGHFQVLTRIAIEELEAWYFGDWEAVKAAYPRVNQTNKIRDPDSIKGGTWELFERTMQKAGYFVGGLRKTEAAQSIAPYINAENNRSPSFNAFYRAMVTMCS